MDTIEKFGEVATLRGLIEGSLTEFSSDNMTITNGYPFRYAPFEDIELGGIVHTNSKKPILCIGSYGNAKTLNRISLPNLKEWCGYINDASLTKKPMVLVPSVEVLTGGRLFDASYSSNTARNIFFRNLIASSISVFPFGMQGKEGIHVGRKASFYPYGSSGYLNVYVPPYLLDWYKAKSELTGNTAVSSERCFSDMETIDNVYELAVTADDAPGKATTTTLHVHLEYDGTNFEGDHVEESVDFDIDSEAFEQNSTEDEVEKTVTYTFEGRSVQVPFIHGPYSAPYIEVVPRSDSNYAGFFKIDGVSPLDTHDAYISDNPNYYNARYARATFRTYGYESLTVYAFSDKYEYTNDVSITISPPSGGPATQKSSTTNDMYRSLSNYGEITCQVADGAQFSVRGERPQTVYGMAQSIFLIPKNKYTRRST